ncbi:hypothetical protein MKQ70_34530 [Chitinophaga sedimenti]|uniref:hypothetical protein n=1 Tax=Chitinophaga sedimenti TaxID=2033606 RepID=UPI002002E82D|nr:hypothetical protein [Chitinophaga sedimenti]MCK7559783.1 hypothetical protein [Chitinophaga sedimenti]
MVELQMSEMEYYANYCATEDYNEDQTLALLRKYFESNSKSGKLLSLSRRIYEEECLNLVYSPLCVMEYVEVITRGKLLDLLGRAIGASALRKVSNKDLGKILKAISLDFDEIWNMESDFGTPLHELKYDLFDPHPNYYNGSLEISGTTLCAIENFSIVPSSYLRSITTLSQYQIGLADIMHLLVAKHLECKNFLTFDHDFMLAKDEIQRLFGLKVVMNVEEMNSIL